MAEIGSKKFTDEIRRPLEAEGYQVIKALGKGAFGEVFLATKSSKQYAIKSICKQLVKKRPFLQKYIKQEIQAMNLLKHPNLVIQQKVLQTPQFYFMVLQFCDQGNLLTHQSKLKTKCFPLRDALDILVQVLQGLRIIHQKNYIHRDIKSENVLIKTTEKGGRIYKIADFGFARPVKSGTASTVCGTQKYMAPEILKNLPYTRSVDIWALGVLFYFMLFADYPFKGHDLSVDIDRRCAGGFKLRDALAKSEKLKDITPELEDFFYNIFVLDSRKRMSFAAISAHPLFTRNGINFEQNRKHYEQIQKNHVVEQPTVDCGEQQDYYYKGEDPVGQVPINNRNRHIAREIESVSFEIGKLEYLKECAEDFFTNPLMMIGLDERIAIRYYVMRAFLYYSKELLNKMEQKKLPKCFQGCGLTEWRQFTASDEYSALLDRLRQQTMKGQLQYTQSYTQALQACPRIRMKYFKDKLTPKVQDSEFQDFKLSYRSATSYVFKKIHQNRELQSHLKNKIKLKLFCCHMINRIFDQGEMDSNFEYYVRWLKHEGLAAKLDFRNFKRWVLTDSKENLDRNIVLLHKIFFSK